MASRDGEHRMVFDIRGRRRHVVKVVYAILAILMGLSLFLVTGAVNLGTIFGDSNSSGSATKGLEENVETYEIKVRKEPENENALLALTKARITLSGQLVNVTEVEGQQVAEATPESRAELQRASEDWAKYLELTDQPSPGGAQVVANGMASLFEQSPRPSERQEAIETAADAQQIVVDATPSLGTVATLALYRFAAFEYEAAEKAGEEAVKLANSKFEGEELENRFEEASKAAHQEQKRIEEAEKADQGSGDVELENQLGGIGGE